MADIRVPNQKELNWLTRRAVAEIVPEAELVKALKSGRHLRIKMGFDPTKPLITMGWAVGLRKLRQFQDLGHTIVVIIGDWTARIGDPSLKSETRPMLTEEEVMANSEAILEQFFRILDRNRTEIRRQTTWFDDFKLTDVVRLSARFTVAQLLERDDFANRFATNQPIGLHELLYPLLQGYDSVAIESDVEFGGTDQKFNILVGRELQREVGQPGVAGNGQAVLLVPLLVGLDGTKKMSQSLGNFIAINEPPNEMYGKLMSIPDSLIGDYFELLTDVPDDELDEIRDSIDKRAVNPMEHKKRLAREIVAYFHSREDAEAADAAFVATFSKGELPEDVMEFRVSFSQAADKYERTLYDVDGVRKIDSLPLPKVLVEAGLAPSTSQARRLIKDGAVDIDGEVHTSDSFAMIDGLMFRVGKHKFLRIVDTDKH